MRDLILKCTGCKSSLVRKVKEPLSHGSLGLRCLELGVNDVGRGFCKLGDKGWGMEV